ncbi:uncharacterized protein [Physcomitrium patens]|uniref:uncharacterized protein n=1 Tax=Physcomitrium patens TaxID=3218 RepID=UPI00024AEC9D
MEGAPLLLCGRTGGEGQEPQQPKGGLELRRARQTELVPGLGAGFACRDAALMPSPNAGHDCYAQERKCRGLEILMTGSPAAGKPSAGGLVGAEQGCRMLAEQKELTDQHWTQDGVEP